MCGIVGFIGKGDGAPAVIDGLKRLEYRGYDSWGIATTQKEKIKFHKQVGKIGGFELKRDLPDFSGSLCIGHTRWATHGGVTEKNSHPHFSCDKKIAVVHNGIVENYQELRAKLEKLGHKFASQTDTEVIAHLLEENLKQSEKKYGSKPKAENFSLRSKINREAVITTLRELEGSYGVGILVAGEDVLYGARKGSPLVLGVGNGEYYIASDVPAFLKHTNKVVFLDEFQLAEITPSGYTLYDINQNVEVKAKVAKIDWGLDEAEKGGHPHFMIKEMLEQPNVIEKTAGITEAELSPAVRMIEKAKSIYIVACGTALHAGIYGSYLLALENNIMMQPISAGEFPHFGQLLKKGDLVITVSQSGETADVLEAVKSAHASGAKVLALVNVMGSSLMRAADYSLLTKAGPEICVLSTKAYVSQQAMFVMISAALKGKLAAARKLLAGVKSDIEEILNEKSRKNIAKMAKKLKLYGLTPKNDHGVN